MSGVQSCFATKNHRMTVYGSAQFCQYNLFKLLGERSPPLKAAFIDAVGEAQRDFSDKTQGILLRQFCLIRRYPQFHQNSCYRAQQKTLNCFRILKTLRGSLEALTHPAVSNPKTECYHLTRSQLTETFSIVNINKYVYDEQIYCLSTIKPKQ